MSEHATPATAPSTVRGHGTGIVVCAIFAALWANWARPLLAGLPAWWAWATAFAVAAAGGALLLAGASMIHRARRLSQARGTGDTAPRGMRRKFMWVLVGEILALNIAAYLLIGHHMAQYLAPAVAIVVGLHFLPLAKIFRSPHFFVTAAVMTLAGIVAAVAMAAGISPITADGVAELVCAVALWVTGSVSWLRMRNATTGHHTIAAAADPAR